MNCKHFPIKYSYVFGFKYIHKIIFIFIDFDPSLVSVPFGDIFQCYLGPFPTPPTGL